ncbi:MAG TPA: Holliday junction resolvase RuvX, partial [Candidatus Syntrophosphaera sp.]|nr:Holliday junction resolvase RuvX [Candidatus Syntrophosphaera sp.]
MEGRILSLDYGEKRIGLALSDPSRILAIPFKVLENRGFEFLAGEIESIINEYKVTLVLVGMPYAIEGGDTPKTVETKNFMSKLSKHLTITVQSWDERYST